MDINDFDLGQYEIKGKYSYVLLQDVAEKKYLKSIKKYIKMVITTFLVMVGIIFFSFILTVAMSHFAIFGTFFGYVHLMILGFTMFFGIYAIFDSLRKIRRQTNIYKFDMRSIKEKLENSDVFMEIPKDDYEKFDSPINTIFWYIKHRNEYKD